jgi:two-component system invasion response regulator UvrY
MNNPPIRIMLIDDHKIVRESWKMLLESNPLFDVVSASENHQSVVDDALKLSPDIILIDVGLSQNNGFTLTKSITKLNPSAKIIGLSISNLVLYAYKMLDLGAKGFITKTSSLEEINHGIVEVYEGKNYLCEEIKRKMSPGELNNE